MSELMEVNSVAFNSYNQLHNVSLRKQFILKDMLYCVIMNLNFV